MKAKFVDKGVPVILGKYGAYRRDNREHVPLDLETHNNSVDHWITYVTKQALANGLIPYWWGYRRGSGQAELYSERPTYN